MLMHAMQMLSHRFSMICMLPNPLIRILFAVEHFQIGGHKLGSSWRRGAMFWIHAHQPNLQSLERRKLQTGL